MLTKKNNISFGGFIIAFIFLFNPTIAPEPLRPFGAFPQGGGIFARRWFR